MIRPSPTTNRSKCFLIKSPQRPNPITTYIGMYATVKQCKQCQQCKKCQYLRGLQRVATSIFDCIFPLKLSSHGVRRQCKAAGDRLPFPGCESRCYTLLAAIGSLVMLQTQTHTHMYANKHTHMQTHKHTHRNTDPPPTPHRWGWGDGRLDDFLHVITLTVFPKELDVFS